jgi:parallel beta-helix repeat protein
MILLVFIFFMNSSKASVSFTIPVTNALTKAETVQWVCPPDSGTGLNSAINYASGKGGGTITLSGSGSLLVSNTIAMKNNVTLSGPSPESPFSIIGANTSGYSYRKASHFVIQATNCTNIAIQYLSLDGDISGYGCAGPMIKFKGCTNVTLLGSEIISQRSGVFTELSSNVHIASNNITITLSGTDQDDAGGAGVWINTCTDCEAVSNFIDSYEVWEAGPANWRSDAWETSVGACDHVAIYGKSRNILVSGNTFQYGNAAAVYVKGVTNGLIRIQDNMCSNFRENGIDISQSTHLLMSGNTVQHTASAGITLAREVTGCIVRDNEVSHNSQGVGQPSPPTWNAPCTVWRGAYANAIYNNTFDGSAESYCVYGVNLPHYDGFPDSVDNIVEDNMVYSGTADYYGGWSNSVSDNYLTENLIGPPPFTGQDVGSPGATGSSVFSPEGCSYEVKGAGCMYSTNDSFQFLTIDDQLSGDGEITVRVASHDTKNTWDRYGIQMRADKTSSGAVYAQVAIQPYGRIGFWRRLTSGGAFAVNVTPGDPGSISAPYWLRLKRTGDCFQGYCSADGDAWTQIGSAVEITNMPATVEAGLSANSHIAGTLGAAVFDHVKITPWSLTSVGSPPVTGTRSFDCNATNVTIKGSGGMYFTTDACSLYEPSEGLVGDGEIVARITEQENLASFNRAGVMMREGLASSNRYFQVAVQCIPNGSRRIGFWRRTTPGTNYTESTVWPITLPVWVKLKRDGFAFSGYYSTNGNNWTQIGPSVLQETSVVLHAGLSVNSQTSVLSSATFDHVEVSQ